MATLLQQFEVPIRCNGETFITYLHGRETQKGSWEAWLVFERVPDGRRFTSPVETTQSNAQAVIYWATGLSNSYFEGALRRAREQRRRAAFAPHAGPIVTRGTSTASRAAHIAMIEDEILGEFRARGTPRVLTAELFDASAHSHADVVRALEDLERQKRMIERRTEEGNDWVFLSDDAR